MSLEELCTQGLTMHLGRKHSSFSNVHLSAWVSECVHVAEYLNLHNLWVLNLPARKIKCLSCLFYTNSLKVTTWLMKGPRL